MPKKKNNEESHHKNDPNVMGLRAEVQEQPICRTLEENYMPYAMSVIVSRAIPEIDGFKPSHRKLLYTMYKMGLLTGARTKSANRAGEVSDYDHCILYAAECVFACNLFYSAFRWKDDYYVPV